LAKFWNELTPFFCKLALLLYKKLYSSIDEKIDPYDFGGTVVSFKGDLPADCFAYCHWHVIPLLKYN
jgi:hypothetical protein